MSLANFIRESILRPRLQRASCMVVYDPERIYRDVVHSLAEEQTVVVDAGEKGIEGREEAAEAFGDLAKPTEDGAKSLIVYVPKAQPQNDHERVRDPYSIYAVTGAMFPDGDGDDYLSICLRAKPDQATEIRRLFDEDPRPSFELVDNIGGGVGYPMLRTVLGVDSARNILLALLAPSEKQKERLKANEGWPAEAKTLLLSALGLKLVTKGKSWSAIADELWRYVLFSEFVLDLPEELPASLATVPHAAKEAHVLVGDLCETLRNDNRTRSTYIERAEQIERDLNLPSDCAGIVDLGKLDTFPFEERTFLNQAISALQSDQLDDVRVLVERHQNSVWLGKGENQAQWSLVAAALHLVEACEDAGRDLAGHTRNLTSIVDHYVSRLRDIDRLQREFEQSIGEYISEEAVVDAVAEQARKRYSRLVEKVQTLFTKHFESEGWPLQGRLANADVFDEKIAPLLEERGRRVAYFLIDALRYELGAELHRQLSDAGAADLEAAYAQMPTVTPVGMASLLPHAGKKLRLLRDGSEVVPTLDGQKVSNVAQRMKVFEQLFGDRFQDTTLSAFVRTKKLPIAPEVNLLVLRSTEIDSHLESNPETTLGLVHQTLKSIRVALHRLKEAGFTDAIIATDHGFFLNGHADAGDVCLKPSHGHWISLHDRALLGRGSGDSQSFAIAADKAGVRGDFESFAAPRSLAPYRRGLQFFHGGPSLQEAVVPVITVRLQENRQTENSVATVRLGYKNGAKRITTRLPVVELSIENADMFSQESDFEILLEAHDRKGNVIGEARRAEPVDPATGTVTLRPGDSRQVTIRMDMEFEGKFKLKALNPVTMAAYASLDLETDYAV